MKLVRLVLATGVALVLLPNAQASAQSSKAEFLIVNGKKADDINQFHWQVALVSGNDNQRDQFCGGTLVAQDWVLTAAHCVDNFSVQSNPRNLDVVAATLKYASGGERMDVEKIVVHPKWKQTGTQFDFDAALLKLKAPAKLVKPIGLMSSGDLPAGPNVRVSGWGATSEGGSGADELLFVDVPVVSTDECNKPESYDNRITAQMFCAGLREGGKDSCQGDSGGPVVSDISGTRQLVGIVSWGHGCARKLKYGVYTRVTTVAQWVADTMKGN